MENNIFDKLSVPPPTVVVSAPSSNRLRNDCGRPSPTAAGPTGAPAASDAPAATTAPSLASPPPARRRRSGAVIPPKPDAVTSGLSVRPDTRTSRVDACAQLPCRIKRDSSGTPSPPMRTDVLACSVAMQGWRTTMEDRQAAVAVDATPLTPPYVALGVYDGHRGFAAAEYCREHLAPALIEAMNAVYREIGFDCGVEAQPPAAVMQHEAFIKSALEDTIIAFDATMRQYSRTHVSCDATWRIAGTTAVTAVATPYHIVLTNVGDCRCIVVGDRGTVLCVTVDHRVGGNDAETARLAKAGATVQNNRVNGLMVSRSLGDFDLKPEAKEARTMAITCVPDVYLLPRVWKDGEQVAAVVAACDGVWDVKSTDEMAKFASENFLRDFPMPSAELCALLHNKLQEVCPSIIQVSDQLRLGSDNLTLGAICFFPSSGANPTAE